MKTLLTLLQMSLLDINNSNVSVILSVFLLECKSHKHLVFFCFFVFFPSPVSGMPPDGESLQEVLGEKSILLSIT